ncbi:MAG: hypothetical protein ABIQ18_20670 [Umezawaea sp.]
MDTEQHWALIAAAPTATRWKAASCGTRASRPPASSHLSALYAN